MIAERRMGKQAKCQKKKENPKSLSAGFKVIFLLLGKTQQ